MNPQRWHRIGEIYHSALPMLPSERSTFVARACGSDTALQQEVNSLLEADESSGDFLQTAVFELGLKILMDNDLKSVETVPSSDCRVPDKLVGTILDERYVIERELGHGGVGVVYFARDRKLHDKPVVVKVLLEESLQEWAVLKFQQEKEALARVDHPGVVGILDTGELPDGKPYIVMQYIDGVPLRHAIKAKPEGMDLELAASILKQVGAALGAVHEKNIYHRDLKPENIMLQKLGRGNEQVKIVDFGLAKVKESVIAPSTVTGAATAGTIVYMSPEQLRGEKVKATSDIYSLAVIAYEVVTGRRPFNPDTIAHLAEMQRQGVRAKPTDLRPRLPEEAERLILKSLSFDPALRHQNAAEFGDELARALMGEDETVKLARNDPVAIQPTRLSIDQASVPAVAKTIPGTFEPAQIPILDPRATSLPMCETPRVSFWLNTRWLKFAISFVFVVVFVAGLYGIFIMRSASTPNLATAPSMAAAERSLVYSLTVQKMRDGKLYQQPFQSSGQEIFENDYKFRLNVSSPQSGYLYVFNEGAEEKAGMSFTLIYPTRATNKGSAKLEANQPMQTNTNTFKGQAGTEEFWIVWSATPVNVLEAARDAAFKADGALTDAAMVRTVKEFLTTHSNPKPETTKDPMRQQTNVRTSGELLVELLELEHR